MAEHLRSISVEIKVDTNKQTYEKRVAWYFDETLEQFERRVIETIKRLTETS